MSRQRVLFIILALFAVVGCGGAIYAFMLNHSNVRQFEGVQARMRQSLQQLQADNAQLGQRLQQLSDEKQSLEERRNLSRSELESVQRELLAAQDSMMRVDEEAAQLRAERDTLAEQVAGLRQQKSAVERRMQQLQRVLSAQEAREAELEDTIAALEAEQRLLKARLRSTESFNPTPPRPMAAAGDIIAATGAMSVASDAQPLRAVTTSRAAPATSAPMVRTRTGQPLAIASQSGMQGQTVLLPPIVVQRTGPTGMSALRTAPPAPAVTGVVIGLNDEHQFIVIDQGIQDGVHVGDQFIVSRGARALGRVAVIRARESVSACDVQEQQGRSRFREGDTVTLIEKQ
jgi:hypothetical protein